MNKKYMVFDVESVGLYGPAFAVGFVVIDENGTELESGMWACDPPFHYDSANKDDAKWVSENCPKLKINCMCMHAMREVFWEKWQEWKLKGALLVADCCYPVETNFLAECVFNDVENRKWNGPYPLIDIGSVLFSHGVDPVKTFPRLENELPIHNPLCDARQSARIFTCATRDAFAGLTPGVN